MRHLLDVNVIVGVLRTDSDLHTVTREWFLSTAGSTDVVLALPETLAAAVRVITNDRVWKQTPTVTEATVFVQALVEGAAIDVIGSSPEAWAQFQSTVTAFDARHRDVPDALLVAQAIAIDAELVTCDKRLATYPGVTVRVLSTDPA